jgi:hypothetical protein
MGAVTNRHLPMHPQSYLLLRTTSIVSSVISSESCKFVLEHYSRIVYYSRVLGAETVKVKVARLSFALSPLSAGPKYQQTLLLPHLNSWITIYRPYH